MSERDFRDFLLDIHRALIFIEEFTKDITLLEFETDFRTQFAVIRCFEMIGEATKRLPDNFRSDNEEVPWKILAGMRDRLIHGYDVVDISLLWRTIEIDIPVLMKQIRSILEKEHLL